MSFEDRKNWADLMLLKARLERIVGDAQEAIKKLNEMLEAEK